jgi:hypothetical protein
VTSAVGKNSVSMPPTAAVSLPAPAQVPQPTPAVKASRAATPARFIATVDTQQVNLGADGLLPELSLQESSQAAESQAASRSGNPLLLILVLAASFAATAVMLFLDTESRRSESLQRSMARQQVADYYARAAYPSHPLEDYQQRLRKALQAHNQGKYADERRYYRQVLNRLRDEGLQSEQAVTGLTGVRKGPTPPSDEHLESLLSQLLSDDGS